MPASFLKNLMKIGRGKRSVKEEIASLTLGLGITALDLVVIVAALGTGLMVCGPRAKDLYASKKYKNAWKLAGKLIDKYQYSRFRTALARAAAKGYVSNGGGGIFELTESGKKRLSELLPSYKQPVSWDGRIWMVTYDIPELSRRRRDLFRESLERIGCRMIQESVWLSIRDPREKIRPLVDLYRLHGKVIISCLGKDGSLGEEDIHILIAKVFKLKQLQKRYKNWLIRLEKIPQSKLDDLTLPYLTILADDPILPKELLPQDWPGTQARQEFEEKVMPVAGDLKRFLDGFI